MNLSTLVLLLSLGLSWSEPNAAKPPCAGQYKPEYKQQFDLNKTQWEALCAGPRKTAAQPQKKPAPKPIAEGLSTTLETRDFNKLYDKYSGGRADNRGAVVVAPQVRSGPPALPKHTPATAKIPVVVPDSDARVDDKTVAKHFKFDPPDSFLSDLPGPLGWVGGIIDDWTVKPIRGAFFSKDEKAYVKAMTDKLQESAEGRKIMRGIVSEGLTVKIQPTQFPGSPLTNTNGLEQVHGTRGMAVPSQKEYHFNANFMKMKDKEVGLESVASNMGHELNHILLHARVQKRFSKEGYDDVLDYALVDEQSARLKGYVVAYELNRGKPNGYIQEARDLINQPDAYWESMKLWSPAYARALDLDEMRDPVNAYKARLEALKGRREELEQEGPDLDYELSRLDHLGNAHGEAAHLTELKLMFSTDKETLPTRKQELQESIDLVQKRIEALQGKEKAFAKKMQDAAKDPRFVALFNDMQGDFKKLQGYKDTKKVPAPKPTPGQWSYKAFEKRWYELHEDVPDGKPPWKEKK